MIIDQPHPVLASVDQYTRTDFIDDPCDPGTVLINPLNRGFRKNLAFRPGILQLVADVFSGALPVIVIQHALKINPLPDRRALLQLELFPEFRLACEDQTDR